MVIRVPSEAGQAKAAELVVAELSLLQQVDGNRFAQPDGTR